MTFKKLAVTLIVVLFSISCLFACAHARPPKPGKNFVWVGPVKSPGGKIIPGHWVMKGKPKPGKVWIKGHYNKKGRWIPGHWK